ncbi:MAG: hypothetical protein EP343_32895 [Deltaproteobacteria bacterium]|nr:MAG: hypothetical protein EP343_32895 [Deltaproteobacteria bacterium]
MRVTKGFGLGLLLLVFGSLGWGCGVGESVVIVKGEANTTYYKRTKLTVIWTSPLCVGVKGSVINVCKHQEIAIGETQQYRFGLENPKQKLLVVCRDSSKTVSYPTGNGQVHEFVVDAISVFHNKDGTTTVISPDCI